MEINTFQPNDIDEVARMAAEVWGNRERSAEFNRVFCGHLARYSFYTPELALQMTDEDGLQAIAFGWMPGDTNDADEWVENQMDGLTDEERQAIRCNVEYLKRTDAELQRKMEHGKSAKLSFFISRKSGCGAPLLSRLTELLQERGVEWLYLWSDCTCNWTYYVHHGYMQIGHGEVPEYSTPDDNYTYMLFRKNIKL